MASELALGERLPACCAPAGSCLVTNGSLGTLAGPGVAVRADDAGHRRGATEAQARSPEMMWGAASGRRRRSQLRMELRSWLPGSVFVASAFAGGVTGDGPDAARAEVGRPPSVGLPVSVPVDGEGAAVGVPASRQRPLAEGGSWEGRQMAGGTAGCGWAGSLSAKPAARGCREQRVQRWASAGWAVGAEPAPGVRGGGRGGGGARGRRGGG